MYAGGSFGQSTLKPDTSGTVYSVADSKAGASQFRLGMDLHNLVSVELDTSVLGNATFARGHEVGYNAASINALIYGLAGLEKRSRRVGFSGYGRIGYGFVQHGSVVTSFDYSDKSVLYGLGFEYGFDNGLAARAEITRVEQDATVMSIGGIYRFGMTPKGIGQVFVNAAKPALGAANRRTDVRNGKVYEIHNGATENNRSSNGQSAAPPALGAAQLGTTRWAPQVSKQDIDGDGVINSADQCADTAFSTTVDTNGCGMFDAVLSDVTFKSGSVWLTPRARGALDKLSTTLLAFPEARVQVRAHTDSDGPADANLGLSARRAESVVAYLTEKGIGELQLETLGLGESQPIDTNDTEAGKKRNRRVELMTLPNITAENLDEALSMGKVAKAVVIVPSKSVSVKTKSAKVVAAEPVFPPISGVKIEPLPKSEFVAGLSLGGILGGVKFRDGSATLTSDSKAKLESVTEQLVRYPEVRLVVMGHTDNQRSPEESKALSTKQANAVVNFLVSAGIAAERLSAEGFGSSLPLAQNLTDADRARNRRIELRVVQ